MSQAALLRDWTTANQRYLVAHFARLKLRLGAGGDAGQVSANLDEARKSLPASAAIDILSEALGLSGFERDVVLLCSGVEMDSELARCCGEAQGYPQRTYATFGLALTVLENPHWSALAPFSSLRGWRLLETVEAAGLVDGRLRIDERILHYLAGVDYLDARLKSLTRPMVAPGPMAAEHRRICDAVLESFQERAPELPIVALHGDDFDAQADVAACAAARLGLELHAIRAEDLPTSLAEIGALAVLWRREAALSGRTLFVESRDRDAWKPAATFAERLGAVVFIAGRDAASLNRATLRFAVNRPDAGERKLLWEQALGATAVEVNGALDGIASQFRLSAKTIFSMGKHLQIKALAGGQPGATLWDACRTAVRSRLADLAHRLEPKAGWDDLVLPEPQKTILRQIAAHAKRRFTVYEQWGFAEKDSRGLGITALFAGESGTGKTMASEALARELHLDLYRIDLSSVVSKYIGETERNLRRVFDAAEDSGAILLFDEADALFGKRSEVKDSHDRYANIEVSYLLQRMEAYSGLAILTTNMKSAIDPAFQRRLRFIVNFPFPDAADREAIWRGIVPPSAPVGTIDYAKLARLHVSGGSIRNIALNAAFFAAESGEPIGMAHIFRAAHLEAAKRERPLSDAETRGWL